MLHILSIASIALHIHQPVVNAILVNPWTQFIDGLGSLASWGIDSLFKVTHNYGWSMLLLALGVSLLLLPLSLKSLKSMQEMQALAPYIKRLQIKYKTDKQKLGEETMKLYREHHVNPLGGCLPMIAQYPFIIGVYGAIKQHDTAFQNSHWLWIGSALSHKFPQFLATSLLQPDHVLLLLYAFSMYFSMKLTPTVSMDPQQQQMMKTQALMMPAMLYFLGSLYHWSSAFVLYWFAFNVLSMVERVYVMKLPSRIPKPPEETPATLAGYPRDCPNCKQLLTVVKGSKCEHCGTKVRKLSPSDNGARKGADGAPAAQGRPSDKGAKGTS
ncbi:MAG: YidC/Oxa1 family membrane protein insertase [Candidatus Eremiobacteraeota bacterium]|nr:YidC/Oxa1 family membrane protein insertase [Candidatus Eremiobacteraeota bacterium]